MTAIVNLMTGPGSGEVTIRTACPHGTDEGRWTITLTDAEGIEECMEALAAQHWRSFDCTCEIGVMVNGEDPVQGRPFPSAVAPSSTPR